jgi:spindle assembly abnormal protein 6
MAAVFDRENPLFERNAVPFEVVSSSSAHGGNTAFGASASDSISAAISAGKRRDNFTVRILQGHRSSRNGSGEKERVIRFEISDEFNTFDDFSDCPSGCRYGIPKTPIIPIIHAPFMSADRGRGPSTMQAPGHPNLHASGGRKMFPKESSHVPSRPIELFELEVGESEFSDLRRDQALLVDFHDFAHSLISLMQSCEMGEVDLDQPREQNVFHGSINDVDEHGSEWNRQMTQPMGQHQWGNNIGASTTPSQTQQQIRAPNQPMPGRMTSPYGKLGYAMTISTYSCRLQTDAMFSSEEGVQWKNNPKSTSMHHARFSIVEANNFRELTHVALNLNVGSDKSVRLYLSSRLNQIMMQTQVVRSLCADHQRRSDSAETEVIGLKKMLNELTQSSEAEKRHFLYQSEEQLRTANSSRSQEVNEVKAAKDAEIKAMIERSEKNRLVLENKVRLLEDVNAKINAEKTECENENEKLATKLSFHETTNNTLANELSSVRCKLERVLDDKNFTEKSLHQLQLQLSTLEYSHDNKEKALSQTEADRISAEKISANAKLTLSSQHSQMEDLRRMLEEAQMDAVKYKDLTSRYQTNRLEMKKRLKEKVEMIREQEDVLVVKEKETSELKVQVRGLEDKLQRTQSEKDATSRELNDALRQMKEDKKKLENNHQVISYLYRRHSTVFWPSFTYHVSTGT